MSNYWNKKKVILTGANGFVGSNICNELISNGAFVTAVVRDKSKIKNLFSIKNKILLKECDLTDAFQTRTLISDENILIHNAALDGGSDFKNKFAHKIFQENTLINLNTKEAIRGKKIEKFVFISSAEVYLNLKKNKKIKEEDFRLFSPSENYFWYPFSKILGEIFSESIEKELGIKTIIVRPANIYGANDNPDKKRLLPLLLQTICSNKKEIILKGDGRSLRSFIFVEDYVKNLLELISVSEGGTYNIAGEKIITIKDFINIFSNLSGLKVIFSGKKNSLNKVNDDFVLDISKIKKMVPIWHDSDYKKRLTEIIRVYL